MPFLSLDSEDALEFLLRSDQYHNYELPEYFVFDRVLQFVRRRVGDMPYEDCLLKGKSPDDMEDVNQDILLNKDGRYAVRPLILANPYLYYFLVRELCQPKGWEALQACFKEYSVPHIKACALPIVPGKVERFHRSATILNWWHSLEQRSIELSLDYRYMFATDITNCYGSINPQSIDWALACRHTKAEHSGNETMAANIRTLLRAMQQGQNIGIPQGNTLFDLISEIILGYSDLLLHEAIEKAGIKEPYEILRYRDDYRVFCNSKGTLEQISYILQDVLGRLNFRMNAQKTAISSSIITDSIKSDKLDYIFNTPIFRKKQDIYDFDSFEKHLLYILLFARKHPNCGQLKTLLADYDERLKKWIDEALKSEKKIEELRTEAEKQQKSRPARGKGHTIESIFANLPVYGVPTGRYIPGGRVRALVAVVTQIALENVSSVHYALKIASRLIDFVQDEQERRELISKVCKKLKDQPNSTYTKLWLQNMTYNLDCKDKKSPYDDVRLCDLVMGKKKQLWNNSFLKPTLTTGFPQQSVVDKKTLKKITSVITFRERRAYMEEYERDNI